MSVVICSSMHVVFTAIYKACFLESQSSMSLCPALVCYTAAPDFVAPLCYTSTLMAKVLPQALQTCWLRAFVKSEELCVSLHLHTNPGHWSLEHRENIKHLFFHAHGLPTETLIEFDGCVHTSTLRPGPSLLAATARGLRLTWAHQHIHPLSKE